MSEHASNCSGLLVVRVLLLHLHWVRPRRPLRGGIITLSNGEFRNLNVQSAKVFLTQSSRVPVHKICVQDFVNKYRPLTITLKSHSLGPLDHTCPFCRSSQVFINILLLLSRHRPFNFLVYIFHTGDELILWFRIYCLVLPKCQDYRIFL